MRSTYGDVSFESPEGFQNQTMISLMRESAGKAGDDDYPISITVQHGKIAEGDAGPLTYLEGKLEQLAKQLNQYELNGSEETTVGECTAAKAHFSFVNQFKLEQLLLIWYQGDNLFAATVSTLPAGVEESWEVLNKLAASFESQ
tara:strand:- start:10 stop:441 length:432 start_codon:yes stop_codon:yes gene_type:complete